MVEQLRYWTETLDEEAQKLGKPEPKYRIRKGRTFEVEED